MTFNIAAGNENLTGIAEVIREANASVVALQEVDAHWSARSDFVDQASSLANQLGMQVRFAPIYTNDPLPPATAPRQFGVAVLSRYPIVQFTNHALTRLSTQEADAAPAPMPGLLDATISVQGTPLRVLNTHLDYRADPAVRMRQVSEMLAVVEPTPTRLIVFGDLNALPDAPELSPLMQRLHDPCVVDDRSANAQATRAKAYTYPAAAPVRRIDFILLSQDLRALRCVVPDTQASDHRPVVVDLTVTR